MDKDGTRERHQVSCGHSNSLELGAQDLGPNSYSRRAEITNSLYVVTHATPPTSNLSQPPPAFPIHLPGTDPAGRKAGNDCLPGTRERGRRVAGPVLDTDAIVPC